MASVDPLVDFSNLPERPHGRVTRTLGRVFPGVREVSAQTAPYADAWQLANRQALSGDGPLWVAVGDSMSQGIGASSPHQGWVGQAQVALAQAGRAYRVVNLSVSGARTQEIIDRQLPTLEALSPDLVTVMVGSNDMMSLEHRKQLPDRFERLIELLPGGAFIANMPPHSGIGRMVNASIDRAATERGAVAVSVVTSWRGLLAADHFHPNDRGYAVIAQAFVAAILKPLK